MGIFLGGWGDPAGAEGLPKTPPTPPQPCLCRRRCAVRSGAPSSRSPGSGRAGGTPSSSPPATPRHGPPSTHAGSSRQKRGARSTPSPWRPNNAPGGGSFCCLWPPFHLHPLPCCAPGAPRCLGGGPQIPGGFSGPCGPPGAPQISGGCSGPCSPPGLPVSPWQPQLPPPRPRSSARCTHSCLGFIFNVFSAFFFAIKQPKSPGSCLRPAPWCSGCELGEGARCPNLPWPQLGVGDSFSPGGGRALQRHSVPPKRPQSPVGPPPAGKLGPQRRSGCIMGGGDKGHPCPSSVCGDKSFLALGTSGCSGGIPSPQHPWVPAGRMGWPQQVALSPWVRGG